MGGQGVGIMGLYNISIFVPDTSPVAYDSKQQNTFSKSVNPKAWTGLSTVLDVIDITDDKTHPSTFQIFYCLTHTV